MNRICFSLTLMFCNIFCYIHLGLPTWWGQMSDGAIAKCYRLSPRQLDSSQVFYLLCLLDVQLRCFITAHNQFLKWYQSQFFKFPPFNNENKVQCLVQNEPEWIKFTSVTKPNKCFFNCLNNFKTKSDFVNLLFLFPNHVINFFLF